MKSTLKKKISAERHGFSARILHWNTAVWTYPYLHFHMAGFRSVVEAWTGVHREKVKGKDLLLFCVLDPVLDFSYKYWCKILPRIPQCEHELNDSWSCHTKGLFFYASSLPVHFYTCGWILTGHLCFLHTTNYANGGGVFTPSWSEQYLGKLYNSIICCSGGGAPYGKSCLAIKSLQD